MSSPQRVILQGLLDSLLDLLGTQPGVGAGKLFSPLAHESHGVKCLLLLHAIPLSAFVFPSGRIVIQAEWVTAPIQHQTLWSLTNKDNAPDLGKRQLGVRWVTFSKTERTDNKTTLVLEDFSNHCRLAEHIFVDTTYSSS